jgi:hypothetical protein
MGIARATAQLQLNVTSGGRFDQKVRLQFIIGSAISLMCSNFWFLKSHCQELIFSACAEKRRRRWLETLLG